MLKYAPGAWLFSTELSCTTVSSDSPILVRARTSLVLGIPRDPPPSLIDQNTAVTYVFMRALCDRCKACWVSMQRGRVKRALLEQACDFFVFGRRSMHAQHHFVISSALNQVLSSNPLPTTASPFFHAHTIALKYVVLYICRQIPLRIVNPIRLLYNHQHVVL